MGGIRLTLITVTKDDPDGLGRTLVSAAALRAAGVEHLVVDGGVGEEGNAGLINVRRLMRPAGGIADAFNYGLANARGEWVWFLNGGDEVDPGLDPAVLMNLLGLSKADALIGGITYMGEDAPRLHPPEEQRWPAFLPWVPHPATLVRRELFSRHGGYDERYQIVMDYEWSLRVLSRADVRVEVISTPLAIFEPGGISQREECRARLASERDDVVRRYQRLGWSVWPRGGVRWLKIWVRACLAKRLDS